MSLENLFLALLAALTCASVVSACLSPSLSASVIYTNDPVFMPGPWDHNKLIQPSEEGIPFNFPLDFNRFLFT